MFGNRIDEKEGVVSKKTPTKNNPASKELEDYIADKIKDQLIAQEHINRVIEHFSSVIKLLSERYDIYDKQRKREGRENGFEDLQKELNKINVFLNAVQREKIKFSNAKRCINTQERLQNFLSRIRGQQWEREKNGTAQDKYKTRDNMERFQDELTNTLEYFSQGDSVTEFLYELHLGGSLSQEDYLKALINNPIDKNSLDEVMLGSKLFYQGHIMERFSTLLEVFNKKQNDEHPEEQDDKQNTIEKLLNLKAKIERFEAIFGIFKPNPDKTCLISIFNNNNHYINIKERKETMLRNFYENFCYCYLLYQLFGTHSGDNSLTILNKEYTISASDYMSDVNSGYDVYLTNKENQSDLLKIDFTLNGEENKGKTLEEGRSNKHKVITIGMSEYNNPVFYTAKRTIARHILNGKPIDLSFLQQEKDQIKEHIESKIQEQLNTLD